jgi:plasmid stability protein
MATLHLRNVPDDLDATLAADAAARGMSKNRRAIEVLRRGLDLDQTSRGRLVEEIRRRRATTGADVPAVLREARPDAD